MTCILTCAMFPTTSPGLLVSDASLTAESQIALIIRNTAKFLSQTK